MDPVEYEMLRHMWFQVVRVADIENGVASGSILGEELVVSGDERSVTVVEGFCPAPERCADRIDATAIRLDCG